MAKGRARERNSKVKEKCHGEREIYRGKKWEGEREKKKSDGERESVRYIET